MCSSDATAERGICVKSEVRGREDFFYCNCSAGYFGTDCSYGTAMSPIATHSHQIVQEQTRIKSAAIEDSACSFRITHSASVIPVISVPIVIFVSHCRMLSTHHKYSQHVLECRKQCAADTGSVAFRVLHL